MTLKSWSVPQYIMYQSFFKYCKTNEKRNIQQARTVVILRSMKTNENRSKLCTLSMHISKHK